MNTEENSAAPEDDENEFFVVPEEAVGYLPEEMKAKYQEVMSRCHGSIDLVQKELRGLEKIANSGTSMVALRHISGRLKEHTFEASLDHFLDLEMLTTAFIVTYIRMSEGKNGSGFSRNDLPESLRATHDQIVTLRNKRFVHTEGHDSISSDIQIGFTGEKFLIKLGWQLGYHIGGANEWHELVEHLDAMMVDRMNKQIAKLAEKTGYEWIVAHGG